MPDDFFGDLAGFLNYAFDSRDLLTVWLVGLPSLDQRLAMRHHAALATRIVSANRMTPRVDRDDFFAMIDSAMASAGATTKLLSEPALELLWRASRGLPRVAAKLLRTSLMLAHDRDHSFVDDSLVSAALDELAVERPTTAAAPPAAPKPRRKSETTSRR